MRMPNPGSRSEAALLAALQPDFMAEARAGVTNARMYQCADRQGNESHTAVNHWRKFTMLGCRMPSYLRPIDPSAPLAQKLAEVDLVEVWAWWLVTQQGVNHETAKSYIWTLNAYHERMTGIALAGGFSLERVIKMLDGLARMRGTPPQRRLRVGVRPKQVRMLINATFDLSNPHQANVAAALEVTQAAVARAGETVTNLPHGEFDIGRLPSRGDVTFERNELGEPIAAVVRLVNCKAKGVEARRKMPVRLPMAGGFISPGWMLYYLIHVIDPVSDPRTPLFRDPRTGKCLTTDGLRASLRVGLANIGLDPSRYGGHSLRIGAATALAFCGADHSAIKAVGRWNSDAFERYVRERRGEYMRFVQQLCSADVDDFEADHLDFEGDLDESDYE